MLRLPARAIEFSLGQAIRAAVARAEQVARGRAPRLKARMIATFEICVLRRGLYLPQRHRLKHQGWLDESKYHEDHSSDEQQKELHRNFCQGHENETQAALGDTLAGEIPLHLALVCAEIGEREKSAA